jgi:hypothetical protein
LPTGEHQVDVGGTDVALRFLPGRDYTVVLTPGGNAAAALLVDDNQYHIRGEARIRVVHASEAARGRSLSISLNGEPNRGRLNYGGSAPEQSVLAGQLTVDLADAETGAQVARLSGIEVAERSLVTLFLYGSDTVQAVQVVYAAGEPAASGESRVRIFNSGRAPLSASIDGGIQLAAGLAPGAIGDYVRVPSIAALDQIEDLEFSIYGHRAGEEQVAWSPDSRRIAFVGAGDGQEDLYIATLDGDVTRLTQSTEREVNPRWSPDGRRLAWTGYDEGFGVFRAYVWSGDEPRPLSLTAISEAAGLAPDTPVNLPLPIGWIDDDRVFLLPQLSEPAGIWAYDAESGAGTPVTRLAAEEVQWSAEARMWVFRVGDEGAIHTVTSDGEARQIVASEGFSPLWSPDGRRISWVEGLPPSTDGWAIHIMNRDGSGDRALTDKIALMQESPPVPGPRAKRFWLNGGESLAFMRVGPDYGAAERQSGFGGTAGNDIENVWIVDTDGGEPRRATDFRKVFYLRNVEVAPDGDALGLVGFSYLDRSQQMWTVRVDGGAPAHIDAGVRWFTWLD